MRFPILRRSAGVPDTDPPSALQPYCSNFVLRVNSLPRKFNIEPEFLIEIRGRSFVAPCYAVISALRVLSCDFEV